MGKKTYLSPRDAAKAHDGPNALQTFSVDTMIGRVTLLRRPKGRYAVLYGLECEECFDYGEAARALGYCLMHAIACTGKLETQNGSLANVCD